jgi:lipid-binding SYLF domain-containing protein
MDGFRSLVKDARGIYISPQILRGAFIVGLSGGSGVFILRDKEKNNWNGPAFYTIGSASFGFQIGGDASEVILLAMTERGVTTLLSSSVKLGADVGIVVGPVGMGAAASTANVSTDIISFARSKGLYGGISVDGAIVKTHGDYNKAFYNKEVTPADILISKTVRNPQAEGLLETAAKIAKDK